MPRPLKRQAFRPAVAIVGDGHTERIYFSDVRDTDRPANLSIFPDYPRKIGHYKGVIDRALALTENYDRVYALIDMDKIIRDNQQNAYTADKAAAKTKGVIVLENNPCFEIWLLVHFIYSGRLFNNCMEVARQLSRNDRIPNYNKSEKFLQNARLYNSYKHLLCQQAMPNAKQLENDRNDQDILFPKAQTFYFFEWLARKSRLKPSSTMYLRAGRPNTNLALHIIQLHTKKPHNLIKINTLQRKSINLFNDKPKPVFLR